jgi:hypothetical protein
VAQLSSATPQEPADHANVVKRLRSFVAEHGAPGTAVIAYLGRPGARIVVVAADGRFADAVVPSMEEAVAACEAAEIPVGSWDRELTSLVTVSHADRVRMAGTGR